MSEHDGSYEDAVAEFAHDLGTLARNHWRGDVLGTIHTFVEELDHGRDDKTADPVVRAYIDGYEQAQGEVLTWVRPRIHQMGAMPGPAAPVVAHRRFG
jgi:hypothetical protein